MAVVFAINVFVYRSNRFQGLAFTLEERQALGIHGLLAAKFKSQEEQLDICRISVDRYEDNLNKYLYLVELQVTKPDKGTVYSVKYVYLSIIGYGVRDLTEMVRAV